MKKSKKIILTLSSIKVMAQIDIQQTSPNIWNNIHFGERLTHLDFVGRASMTGDCIGFTFSLIYNRTSGFKVMGTPVASGVSSVFIIPVNSIVFNIIIDGEIFNTTVDDTNRVGSIQMTNANGYTIMGTFAAISQI
ncbi:hypothetical protein [Chryseobacterium sp.]|uniref:hypothetical protein n=2 Tax=Chryseobacterium sp. TaxID=1871047 RepID=UPI002FC92D3A